MRNNPWHLADQPLHATDNLREGGIRLFNKTYPLFDMPRAGADYGVDLPCGIRRPLRQRAHFPCDNREAAPGIPCPRRLDTGIQDEKIGLKGNVIHDADDLADPAGSVLDMAHGISGCA